jgi:hypothetical protein
VSQTYLCLRREITDPNLPEPRPAYRGITTINPGYHEQAENCNKTLNCRITFHPLQNIFLFTVRTLHSLNMVADTLVYHPSVAHYLKFVATTVGRDKLLRTIQYFSRFYAWYLFRTNATPGEIAPWESIKKQFGLIRKAMRVGPPNPLKSARLTCPSLVREERRALQGRRRRRRLQEPGSGDQVLRCGEAAGVRRIPVTRCDYLP